MGTALQLEEEPIKYIAQQAENARNNFDHGKNVHKTHDQIKGVDDIIEIDSKSDSDSYEDADYIPRMVKREDSDSRYDGSEVDPEKNQDDMLIEDVNEGEGKKSPCLGRGHRIRTQTTTNYVPSWNNKSNRNGDPKGVNMAHIESIGTSYPDDNELRQG